MRPFHTDMILFPATTTTTYNKLAEKMKALNSVNEDIMFALVFLVSLCHTRSTSLFAPRLLPPALRGTSKPHLGGRGRGFWLDYLTGPTVDWFCPPFLPVSFHGSCGNLSTLSSSFGHIVWPFTRLLSFHVFHYPSFSVAFHSPTCFLVLCVCRHTFS